MLDFDPNALAITFERGTLRQADRRTKRLHPRGVAAMIRVLALLHVVLVTTGAMDSSWAMAKASPCRTRRSPRRCGSDHRDWCPRRSGVTRDQPLGSCGFSPEHAQHALEVAWIVCVEERSFPGLVQIPETR